jgi:hypothetical protein
MIEILLNTAAVIGSFVVIIAVAAAFGKLAQKVSGRE